MVDLGMTTENGMSVTPPLQNPASPNYEKLNTDIPLEQPLIFYLDNSKTFYLPHESTTDEDVHSPQNVVNTLTKERIFEQVNIRQGQSGMQHINCLFLTKDGPVDLTNIVIRFAGKDASEAEISDDEIFDTTQASLGRLTWKPSAVISQVAGRYKTAHFVIENADRTKILTTLDFTINIIANDVSYPRALAFYMSEYQRALFHIKEMETNADKQLNYLLNFESVVISDSLNNLKIQVQESIDDANEKLKAGTDKVDQFISISNNKLTAVNASIDDAQKRMDGIDSQIKSNNILTNDTVIGTMQSALDSGQITINVDNLILDHVVSARIDELNDYITESEGGIA
ncbi:phage baseplate upper protein [Companilactobacillus allii]|uniref:BppU N-terminal domain-containing protein n=1 Tax=Companilactobacillus allii TaxID=1847728 RepID=A0A1P8Q2J6_9LACO|nr:BppU family phage baseplate upper protein [Companilactobacillus allii]APX72093.1 hypothetical protein BTM29_05725 [Companilactobacillus allii]USQ69185.1 phage baseplate upper protein [Companilactobacillus allii]